jgi:pyrroloquinoline quinone biosynthesis protein D
MTEAATASALEGRPRTVADARSAPHMPPYVRLQFDDLRKKWVVLSPERVFWPDEVTVDILKLCDGKRSIAAIAEQLATEYSAPREVIEADILEFIQSWTDIRLLRL